MSDTSSQVDAKPYSVLQACLDGGRLPHAMLVEGPADARQAFVAAAAQGAICSGVDIDRRPCGVCRDCVKAEKGVHPDILIYGGEGGSRSFHVDLVREIRREAYMRPNEGPCKVLILCDVQEMTIQAENALLKVIEEPPAGIYFVLTCDNKSALLDTVLSRVALFSLRAQDEPTPEADNETNLRAQALAFLEALVSGAETQALVQLGTLERDKEGFVVFLEACAEIIRELLLDRAPEHPAYAHMASRATLLQHMQILAIIEEIAGAVPQNVNRLLLATALCSKIKLVLTQ